MRWTPFRPVRCGAIARPGSERDQLFVSGSSGIGTSPFLRA